MCGIVGYLGNRMATEVLIEGLSKLEYTKSLNLGFYRGDKDIIVCTGLNFADSLSASATGKPILLVWNESGALYGKQPEFLSNLKNCTFTVIGGESAVSAKLFDAIKAYGTTTRLAGANRFETSVLVAQKYFASPETAVLAYAWNYPDGLCGGSLAFSLKAPLILTMTKYEAKAVEYAKNAGIEIGLVLGGDTLISDDAVLNIFQEQRVGKAAVTEQNGLFKIDTACFFNRRFVFKFVGNGDKVNGFSVVENPLHCA